MIITPKLQGPERERWFIAQTLAERGRRGEALASRGAQNMTMALTEKSLTESSKNRSSSERQASMNRLLNSIGGLAGTMQQRDANKAQAHANKSASRDRTIGTIVGGVGSAASFATKAPGMIKGFQDLSGGAGGSFPSQESYFGSSVVGDNFGFGGGLGPEALLESGFGS